ncbi:MAG TPA: metallopeptidase TldD-related protein, partial [bacterium]
GRYLDLNYHGIGKKEMKDAVVECSTTASRLDKRIKNVRKTTFSKTLTGCRIINSRGVDIADERSDFSLIQEVIADDERDSVTSWDFGFSHLIRDIDPMSVGINSAKRSLELLGGKREQTGDFRAVFSNLAAAELAGVLSKSFLSESVHKNKSPLKGKLGERIFSDKLTIRDNGVHPSGWNLFAFDGEGISPVDTLLVDRGILSGFLYDLYYAQIFGKKSTGNSNRDDYTAAPSQGVTNFFIDPGTESLDNLINEMDNGLIITGLLGVHTSNPITGEFSLGAEGHRVINGEKHYPIRGITISGNIFELFKNIVMVGNDIRFMGRYGSPSLLVQKITVGGE